MAASEATKEAIYLRHFLEELDEGSPAALALSVDNKAAIDLAYNPEHHQKTKHIERRHFYVRELVEQLRITVPYVASADNLADFFTKALGPKTFLPLRDIIMNVPTCQREPVGSSLSVRGGVLSDGARRAAGRAHAVHGGAIAT